MNSFCDCLYNIITCYIKLEASDLASVSAGHHDKKSVLCIGCISPEFSYFIHLIVYFECSLQRPFKIVYFLVHLISNCKLITWRDAVDSAMA